ncbi:hypothetical protein NDU88_003284 [Pleurodeles waltl]|uniref:Uncharacterized protein n=1 Tax=Pleurodeles waltl TaxID=8319 RepID=A0AAV7RHT3_PLEWA|nr:hypothetical protein NDU88_003284 [Pleurodeles waltl]
MSGGRSRGRPSQYVSVRLGVSTDQAEQPRRGNCLKTTAGQGHVQLFSRDSPAAGRRFSAPGPSSTVSSFILKSRFTRKTSLSTITLNTESHMSKAAVKVH